MSEGLVWLNGNICREEEAMVLVNDRGFLFGDGIYEVVRVYHGRPFALDAHLERLERSAEGILLKLPFSRHELEDIALEMLRRTGMLDAELYIQVTRGVAARGLQLPSEAKPTVFVGVKPPRSLPAFWHLQGIALETLPDDRWAHCDIKAIGLLASVLALEKARQSGAQEALFIRQGLVTECASSNFFLMREGVLATPPADWRLLRGVTRSLVLQLAEELKIPHEERPIPAEELPTAEEAFITSTFRELVPVVQIDGHPIQSGVPGPTWRKLRVAYQALHEGKDELPEG